jgi:4-oxalocrotonate tautomerase
MPYVNIRVAGSLSVHQKAKIAAGVTEVISREAGKPKEAILVFIDESERQNVAKAGKLLDTPTE